MSINLVTYANQTVTPTNDAIIYERAIDQNGIFYGCNVTVTSNTVNITGGYGLVCGREFVINSDSLTVTLAPSGTLEGRLYVRLDLADADAPIQLLTVTGNTLPALTQDDDVNYTNGVYEMELATFTVGVSALSDCVETYDTIVGMADLVKNIMSPESITFTYSSNSYVNNTDFARINGVTVGKIAIINVNLYLTNAIPANGSATIGSMDVSSLVTYYVSLPCQSSGNHLTMSLSGSSLSVSNGYSSSLGAGWYRGVAVIAIQ